MRRARIFAPAAMFARARSRNLTEWRGRSKGLPLVKGAAERSEAEGFAPTGIRSDFKNCCFQMILPYPLRANPPSACCRNPSFSNGVRKAPFSVTARALFCARSPRPPRTAGVRCPMNCRPLSAALRTSFRLGHRSRSLLRSLTSGSTDSGYPLSYELSPSLG